MNPPPLSFGVPLAPYTTFGIGGRARLYTRRHANFVLNGCGATAADVHALMELVAGRVVRHSGLRLEPELAFLGAVERGAVLR